MSDSPYRADGGDEAVSAKVIRTVAVYADVEPAELPPLCDVVDPDALDAIFGPQSGGRVPPTGRVVFPFAGFEVTVSSVGSVEAVPLDAA